MAFVIPKDEAAAKKQGPREHSSFKILVGHKTQGKAWRDFFRRYGGQDLDNIRGLKKLGGFPMLVNWESIRGKGWEARYAIESGKGSDKGYVGLVVHIAGPKGYVGTLRTVIAPIDPIAKDAQFLKQVASGAIEHTRSLLVAASKGKVKKADLKPTPREYTGRIHKMKEDVLRGAPIFDLVSWPRGSKVAKGLIFILPPE